MRYRRLLRPTSNKAKGSGGATGHSSYSPLIQKQREPRHCFRRWIRQIRDPIVVPVAGRLFTYTRHCLMSQALYHRHGLRNSLGNGTLNQDTHYSNISPYSERIPLWSRCMPFPLTRMNRYNIISLPKHERAERKEAYYRLKV